jgi:hypothetical protein
LLGGIDLFAQQWAHAAFAFIDGVPFSYAVVRFVGLKESVQDLKVQILPKLALPVNSATPQAQSFVQ